MSSTVIDHAIAIPTKQRNVWEHLRDIQQYPVWQVDKESISFLTTKRSGRGTRFRTTTARGTAQVIEITAWYEGLGYEYVIVDGTHLSNNRGRIRLQESPEGTIVQWTFSYDVSGFLGGIRNALGARRRVDNDIIDSLRNLYSYIKELRGEEKFIAEESSAYLKEAPDVEERSKYQPRYPSKLEQEAAQAVSDTPEPQAFDSVRFERPKPETREIVDIPEPPEPEVVPPEPEPIQTAARITEPPVMEEDTTPNPSIAEEPKSAAKPLPEPSFLKDIPDFSQAAPEPKLKPEPLPRLDEVEDTTESLTEPAPQPANESTVIQPREPELEAFESVPDMESGYDIPPLALSDESDDDTSRISVFEVFGLPKPSETENLRAIDDEILAGEEELTDVASFELELESEPNTEEVKAFMADTPIEPDIEPESAPRRGLRAAMRRKKTRVRLPK
jgi:uncharacterized membrane protein